ncbi:MAG: trehalase-like domain-containing protein, partial [Candidatus Limnocylindrales bacterium]
MRSIGDYGLLSDCRTAALVSRHGSIDWHCPISFDAPSVFGRLLDPDGGHWRMAPLGETTATRRYVGESLVLRTQFDGADGAAAITDFLSFAPGTRAHDIGKRVPHALVRIVEGLRGRLVVELDLAPRFEYGLIVPWLEQSDGAVEMRAGPSALRLETDVTLELGRDRITGRFTVEAGQTRTFTLRGIDPLSEAVPDRTPAEDLLEATLEGWRSWNEPHVADAGIAGEMVRR